MASTLDELRINIEKATSQGYRQHMLAQGQSRGMIWRDGSLPENSPNFDPDLSYNLLSFGYSLLLQGLRFADLGGDKEIARVAFEVAAEALEAVVAKGQVDSERDFHRLVAASAYHLGRYSARAYSLLDEGLSESNLTPMEFSLAKLMLRNLDGQAKDITSWFSSGIGSDDSLMEMFAVIDDGVSIEDNEIEGETLEAMTLALDGNFMSAMSQVMLALERGDRSLIDEAHQRLQSGLSVAGELSLVAQWWIHRLTIQIINELWDVSFHKVLPQVGPFKSEQEDWEKLRKLFIASLNRRNRAEIELWPSQLEAAKRALDFDVNLVLSLPTSAGKTRIAEMCILACLACKKRVLFITPLRALSAQTEVSLRRTFGPLGKSVSSLYGSIGASGDDVNALRSDDIVVATPEKLDFALRGDPGILDDIGLIVLDEGHMIGLGEREVRYEAQIQRLLRRPDAAFRRIICLSAILPDGDQLEDFVAWLTDDKSNGLIKNDWRPTRLRFGEVDWSEVGKSAQLNITVGEETPFVPRFIVGREPSSGHARKVFPSDQAELCIATAWKLMGEGQTVLVFCPLRRSVLPFAKRIIEMHKRGHIKSVLDQPPSVLAAALSVGAEWFGADHELLKCLRLGVAVHHGELPSAYRKQVERLLREGILKLTVSSPTLAQGLNLSATSLIFQGLVRDRKTIDVSEFRNVVGRAGRAYIDIEGLVLYPMFDNHHKRRLDWNNLIASSGGREMESGIFRLILAMLLRISAKLGTKSVASVMEYVFGQWEWEFPTVDGEPLDVSAQARLVWQNHLSSLDTAIFSLIGEADILDEDMEIKLGEMLTSSLFSRRLKRIEYGVGLALYSSLVARAKFIWSNSNAHQRRGYFLAGVGFLAGQELDNHALELEKLLLNASIAIEVGNADVGIESIIKFARIVFQFNPFKPRLLPSTWEKILKLWLLGQPIPEDGEYDRDETVSLIEHAFTYNLPWAMEAVRVRSGAHQVADSPEVNLSKFSAYAVKAVETGTLSVPASILIQAGFASRIAAIIAVESTGADFKTIAGMMSWIASDEIQTLALNLDWPTPESHELWMMFVNPNATQVYKSWAVTDYEIPVKWYGAPMPSGTPLRVGGGSGKEHHIYTSDFQEVGEILHRLNSSAIGLTIATATDDVDKIHLEYIGPVDLV